MKKEFVIALKQQKDRILERFISDMEVLRFYTTEQRKNYINLQRTKMDKYILYIVSKINFFDHILPESTLDELQEYLELDDNVVCSGFYDYLS